MFAEVCVELNFGKVNIWEGGDTRSPPIIFGNAFNYWEKHLKMPLPTFKTQSAIDQTSKQKSWKSTMMKSDAISFTFNFFPSINSFVQTGPHSPYSPHPSSESQMPPNFNGGFNGHLSGPNGHLGGPNGHLGGPNGHLPGGLSSHMQGGGNSHLPPNYPSPSQQQLPPALSTLNVTNPRYAAK